MAKMGTDFIRPFCGELLLAILRSQILLVYFSKKNILRPTFHNLSYPTLKTANQVLTYCLFL